MNHILIIEDNPDDIIIAKRILSKTKEAFDIQTATSGKEAIEILNHEKFDCFLIDHGLPDTNALELLKHVRKMHQHQSTPAIVLTGLRDERLLNSALKLGAVDFLTKDNIQGNILPERILEAIASGQRSKFMVDHRERIYERLIDAMGEGLFVIDLTETIVLVNHALTGILKEQESNLLGRSIFSLMGEDGAKIYRQKYPLVKASQECSLEIMLVSTVEKGIPVLIHLTSLFDENNVFNGVMGVVTDLTQIKEMQARLVEAERLAMMAKTVSEVAHEVRNPLAVINNTIFLLKDMVTMNETIEKHFQRMEHQVTRIDSYFSDLLNLAKPLNLNLMPTNINTLIEKSIDNLPTTIFSGIELIKEFGENIPLIQADHIRMKEIFINLIKNACEIMHNNGRLRIKTEAKAESIQISFEDTGPGIPPENIERIFEPFFTTRGRGTGIGLSICQRFVLAHQGVLKVKTELGKGSVFIVRLPIGE